MDREDNPRKQRAPPECVRRYTRITLAACSPLSPVLTSNSTAWPSASVLNPSICIAEKWTNTSSPPSCSMNPYPFASLNHFTFPRAMAIRPPAKSPRERLLAPRPKFLGRTALKRQRVQQVVKRADQAGQAVPDQLLGES